MPCGALLADNTNTPPPDAYYVGGRTGVYHRRIVRSHAPSSHLHLQYDIILCLLPLGQKGLRGFPRAREL